MRTKKQTEPRTSTAGEIVARFRSRCLAGDPIVPGDRIVRSALGWHHVECEGDAEDDIMPGLRSWGDL